MIRKAKLLLLYFKRIVFAKSHLNPSIITKIRANIFGGFLADQYILFDLKNNDKNEYLSELDWHRSRFINQPYDFLLNNKIACYEIIKHHIDTPRIVAIKQNKALIRLEGESCHYDNIIDMLMALKMLFIKPISDGRGNGVSILKYNDGAYYIDSKKQTRDGMIAFLKDRNDWILTEVAEQHRYSRTIYDKTYNTIRLITTKDPKTNMFNILFALHRIGTDSTIPVDNCSKGALVSKINLETGVLSAAKSLRTLDSYTVHPNSGAQIEGVHIPNWDMIKQKMLILSNKLPYLQFIAWDIIVKPDGEISVIEANNSSGVNIIQVWGGQRTKELGNFYRYHNVIK